MAHISGGGAQVEAGWAEPPRATPHFNHCGGWKTRHKFYAYDHAGECISPFYSS